MYIVYKKPKYNYVVFNILYIDIRESYVKHMNGIAACQGKKSTTVHNYMYNCMKVCEIGIILISHSIRPRNRYYIKWINLDSLKTHEICITIKNNLLNDKSI
jgi:hypothetical protein